MTLSNVNRHILIAGIIIAIILSSTVFLTIPKEKELLPDRYAHFDYSFSYPDIAEEIDKSKELKAWVGYDKNFLQRPFVLYMDEVNREWLPSSSEIQKFMDNNPIVKRIIVEHGHEWISLETARSLVEQYWGANYGALRGHCGQYKYINTYALFIPTSQDEIAFVPVVLPDPTAVCYPDRLLEEAYGPLLDTPSIEQRRTFDFADILVKLYEFLYSNSLLLGVTPIVLIGALIWRGTISRIWLMNGFDYNHFELMVKLRGSKTRLEILRALDVPKTRQQIARELNLDWKAVNRHIEVLLKNELVCEVCSVGRTSYYMRSEKGDRLLDLLNNGYSDNGNRNFGMFSIALFLKLR